MLKICAGGLGCKVTMSGTKVTTVIVNQTEQGLTLKVGNPKCYARLTSVKVGGEYRMHLDINWTYQEFVLQDKHDAHRKLFLNSDDCCDYERITVTEADGHMVMHRIPRKQFLVESSPSTAAAEAADAEQPKQTHHRRWIQFWL